MSVCWGTRASKGEDDRTAGSGYTGVPRSESAMPKPSSDRTRPAVVVMGVSGSGKSACGSELARRAGIDFVDGDMLHPATNVAKMSAGQPLTDDDRWPWLDRVGAVLADGAAHPNGIAVACSALRRRYRDRIRAMGAAPVFVFLDIPPQVARERLGHRPGHFMPVSLVDSQFETLERPAPDETDVVTVEETGGVEATAETALRMLTTMVRS